MSEVAIRAIGPDTLRGAVPDLLEAHRAVYRSTDEEVEEFRPVVLAHGSRAGFRMVLAEQGDEVVGFAYGFTGSPGQGWRDAMARHLGPEAADQWLDGHFEFAQFGVVPGMRRQGIGGRLYHALFDGLPHRRSVLTVVEANEPALAFYRARDWVELGRGFEHAGHGPYHILGKDLGGV